MNQILECHEDFGKGLVVEQDAHGQSTKCIHAQKTDNSSLQGKIETCSVAGGDLGDHFLDTRPLFFLWFSIDFSFDFDASKRMFFTLILSLQKSITVLDF